MGIQVNQTKIVNSTGVELPSFYVGLSKINSRDREHTNIQISSNSNTYTITGYFDHHITKDAKTQGKIPVENEIVTVSNVSVDSNINIVSELYTELKKGYETFTDDV